MGMFDNFRCEIPLPDGWTPGKTLQTKDFDCDMRTITLNAQGRLVDDGRPWHSGEVTEAEFKRIEEQVAETRRLLPDYMPGKTYTIVPEERIAALAREIPFHGMVEFYGDEPAPPGATGAIGGRHVSDSGEDLGPWVFHVYVAKFTDGLLQEITAMPDGPTVRFTPPEA